MKEEFKKKEMSEKIIMLLESSCKDFKGIKTAYAEACAELKSKFESFWQRAPAQETI